MKLSVLGIIMLLIPLGHAAEQGGDGRGESRRTNSVSTPPFDLSAFATEVPIVEEALGRATGVSREDALAMYGRSSAASGRFDVAAAAYAMFLNEFGTGHPNSERVAARLADYLFPFKYDQIDVVHTASGPRLEPAWRMGFSPRPEHLRQAVPAFELAASLAQNEHAKGSALLKLGWVHRVLGVWDASTTTWDRCAKDVAPTKSAADALWLAAENLEWTNRPAEAAERLKQLLRDHPEDSLVAVASDRIGQLQAEALWSTSTRTDSVALLVSEIQTRSRDRSAQEVYRSLMQGLKRRGEREAWIAVSRWASNQDSWPDKERVLCRCDLVDALLSETSPSEAAKQETTEVLREITEISNENEWAVPAALHRYRLLNELHRFDEADRFLADFGRSRIEMESWGPMLLVGEIEGLVARGESERARASLARLQTLHPDVDVSGRFEALIGKGESR